MSEQTSAPEGETIALRCMEIWGGNRAVEQSVSVPGIDVHVVSRPHGGDESGGDIYYVSQCGAGNIARIALADVAGHGVGVSELSSTLQGLMRKHINTADMTRLARALNTEFDAISRHGRFATAILATYWAPTDHLILVNAGHPPPLRYRAGADEWSFVDHEEASASEIGVANLPLGVIEPTSFGQIAIPLGRGDVVILYTDALVEAAGADGRMLGQDGLLELARRLDARDRASLGDRLRTMVRETRGGKDSGDDETIVVLAHNGSDPPRHTLGETLGMLGRMLGLTTSVREAG
ncbi:MAG: PP2C family protein-serine/threonine phosphatase [Phycisphaerales bacterium]